MSKEMNGKSSRQRFGKHLTVILKEMCKRVGAKYEDIDFKSHDWFRSHKWSCKEQAAFEKWLADYLYKSKEALLELCGRERSYVNKTWCLKAAKEFTFMYGWSLSDYPPTASQGRSHKTV